MMYTLFEWAKENQEALMENHKPVVTAVVSIFYYSKYIEMYHYRAQPECDSVLLRAGELFVSQASSVENECY